MSEGINYAPGWPGVAARWTSSSKSGVGKALSAYSNVSFTISHGIVNEVYFPREDQACTRDMQFLVSDGNDFFSEEKRDTKHSLSMIKPGVPAYKLTNECISNRYAIEKEVLADPQRNTFLQRIRFKPKQGQKSDYHLYVLLAPHINNQGAGNTGWIRDYRGVPMLFAQRGDRVMALASTADWLKRSVGFVGASDGWTDIHQNKQMTREFQRAENGNIALTAEIDLSGNEESFTLALGFGYDFIEAAQHACASMIDGFDMAKENYINDWIQWHKSLKYPKFPKSKLGQFSGISAAVLRAHEAKEAVGGIIASMSIPWGSIKGDQDIGGYHLVWPRDLVETAGGMLALNSSDDAVRVLNYLMSTQEADGHWSQNMWIEGKPYWQGTQMDQTALPVLLIDLCLRHQVLKPELLHNYWAHVKRAVGFLIRKGPYTQMDRWEEEAGFTPFTIAVEIAALLAAAEFADQHKEKETADYLRQTADYWNDHIEHWLYVTGSDMAGNHDVEGYYIRNNPYKNIPANELEGKQVQISNRNEGDNTVIVNEMISPDALALVRYGLRAPDDPKILNTIKVIDEVLKVQMPNGVCWYRYNHDGYGEKEDASPYDGTGVGRTWPLLTGERAHYEIAAGNTDQAANLLKGMESFAHEGLFSEQIWDQDDIEEKELIKGKPSGSAMPLVWAHAEYIKLCNSLKNKEIFDMPLHTKNRYLKEDYKGTNWEVWRFNRQVQAIPKGKNLRIETNAPAKVHWSDNEWDTVQDSSAQDTDLGIYYVDIPVKKKSIKALYFTFYWPDADKWEGENFTVRVKDN